MSRFFHFPFSIFAVLLVAILLNSCKEDPPVPYRLNVPSWFPKMEIPSDNQLTTARVQLGRKLFFDPLLSSDTTVSCGSCHLQEKAFAQNIPFSSGVGGALGFRNSPTLANIGYAPYFFHDGGVQTLELQAQTPIFAVEEMNFTIAGFINRIKNDAEYERLFKEAYNRVPDAFGISRAIASFERTLISANSRFDRHRYLKEENLFSAQELRGEELFFSNLTNCAECHIPPLFTNYQFANIGLYETYADSGRERVSRVYTDNGKFKVPTLRNIELTAPYMHDGSLETLQEVITHFNTGGVGHSYQSELVVPLQLSEQQQQDLVAFLRTLTDISFISDPQISDPN